MQMVTFKTAFTACLFLNKRYITSQRHLIMEMFMTISFFCESNNIKILHYKKNNNNH